jgi:hypothetical protein
VHITGETDKPLQSAFPEAIAVALDLDEAVAGPEDAG